MPSEAAAIGEVVVDAFGRPAEAGLIEALRLSGGLALSLVATSQGKIVGHVALSPVEVASAHGDGRWLALAPLAVAHAHQRRGIGSALVRRALEVARERQASAVFVLGRSRFYGRLGFDAAGQLGWRCTYPAAEPAFRVCRLGEPGKLPPPGTVRYHSAFDAL